jgi:hypothetical protein
MYHIVQEFPLLARRATDCLEDMGNSAIVHDGIFGYGDEGQNMAAEKAFEDAQARGFRPCSVSSSSFCRLCVSHLLWACPDGRQARSGLQENERHPSELHPPFQCL